MTVPPLTTAATGIDALTHAIEGYTPRCTEPIAEAMGLYAVEYIAKNIAEAVRNGGNLEARDGMMMEACWQVCPSAMQTWLRCIAWRKPGQYI